MAGAEVVAQQNSRTIRPDIPKGAIAFLNTQSLIIAASVEEYGRVWSSFLTGEPGFIEVEDEVTLTIQSNPVASDPLTRNLLSNPELGLLAIDFSKRIRMRINGTGAFDADRRLVVKTEQVYGNCPKYIQKRSLHPNGGFHRFQKSEHRSLRLSRGDQLFGKSDSNDSSEFFDYCTE
jgi:predicted pyridoxine 5'-phosphate oxidase superfamily flavin-nucleotide-binding protein